MSNFNDSIEQHRKAMIGAIRKTRINPSHVMDCFQEAYVKLAQMDTISYIEPSRVRALFCKVATNVAIDKIRRENTLGEKGNEAVVENRTLAGSLEIRAAERENRIHKSVEVHRVLSRLPELDSYIAWQYYAQQLSLREITYNLRTEKGINWSHMRVKRYIRTSIYPRLKDELKGLV